MSTQLIVPIVAVDSVLLVDSRVIAEKCGVEHRSLYKLLGEYQATIEAAFGLVRFEIADGEPMPQGGTRNPQRFALLTEQQATFVITLTRNTAPVIAFKIALVKAFYEARQRLQQPTPPKRNWLADKSPAGRVKTLERVWLLIDKWESGSIDLEEATELIECADLLPGLQPRACVMKSLMELLGNTLRKRWGMQTSTAFSIRILGLNSVPIPEPPLLPPALPATSTPEPAQKLRRRKNGEFANKNEPMCILGVMGAKTWRITDLERECAAKLGMTRATFYRKWGWLKAGMNVSKGQDGFTAAPPPSA